jgi:hypothetical protein
MRELHKLHKFCSAYITQVRNPTNMSLRSGRKKFLNCGERNREGVANDAPRNT